MGERRLQDWVRREAIGGGRGLGMGGEGVGFFFAWQAQRFVLLPSLSQSREIRQMQEIDWCSAEAS